MTGRGGSMRVRAAIVWACISGSAAAAPTPSLDEALDARLAQHTQPLSAELEHLQQRLDALERRLPPQSPADPASSDSSSPSPDPQAEGTDMDPGANPGANPGDDPGVVKPTIRITAGSGPLPSEDDGTGAFTVTAEGWPAGHALTVWCWSQQATTAGGVSGGGGNVALGHGTIDGQGRATATVTLRSVRPGAVVLIADVHPANLPPDPDRDGIRARHALQRITPASPDQAEAQQTGEPILLSGIAGLRRITIDQLPGVRSGMSLSNLLIDAQGGPGLNIPPGTRDVVLERVYVVNAGGGSYLDKAGNRKWHFGTAGFTIGRDSSGVTLLDCGNFDSAGGPNHGRRMQGIFIAGGCSDITIARFVGQNIHGPENKQGELPGAGAEYPLPYDDQYSHLIYAIDVTGLTVNGAALIGGDGQVVKVASSRPGGSSGVRLRGLLGVWNSAIAMTGPTDSGDREFGRIPGMVVDYQLSDSALVDPDGWNATAGTSSVWGFWALGTRPQDCRVERIGRYQFDPRKFVERLAGAPAGSVKLNDIVEERGRVTVGDDVADHPDRVLIADIDALIREVRSRGYGDWCDAGVLMRAVSAAK